MPKEKEIQFTDRLRAATREYIANNNLRIEDVAVNLGCSRQNLQNFLAGAMLGDKKLDTLVAIVWKNEALIAAQLRWVANVLDSPDTSKKIKSDALKSLIDALNIARYGE